MAVETKPSSRWFYARLFVNGVLRRFPLMEVRDGREVRIEVKGRRPKSMARPQDGDAAFLESYHRAKAAHDRLREEQIGRATADELAQRLIEAKTGSRLDFVKVADAADAWAALPRARPPCDAYLKAGRVRLARFARYMGTHFPEVEELAAVRADQARAFLDEEDARGGSPRTHNITLKFLRTLFSKLEPNADAYRAFLRTAPFLDEDTIHREPFTDEELAAVLEAARADAVLSGPIIVAVCTAMRRGDCCKLAWRSVDLGAGFIEVKTSKTGETAEIPIMPLLRAEIEPRDKGDGKGYVFPEAAALYENDQPALDRRLRLILNRAGCVDDRHPGGGGIERPDLPELPTEELRRRGLDAITRADMAGKRRERMAAIFGAYVEGKGLPAIARELGVSKSTVSLHLNEVEAMTGAAVLRRTATPAPEVVRGTMHAEAGGRAGRNRVSVRGWHSFRTTFITRALAAGMPEELVRRVTGHSGVDVVRKFYFRPDREAFRREFEKAMPGLAMNGAGAARSRDERLAEIVEGMNARNWRGARKALLEILKQERKG